jgi:hypothetical protein
MAYASKTQNQQGAVATHQPSTQHVTTCFLRCPRYATSEAMLIGGVLYWVSSEYRP